MPLHPTEASLLSNVTQVVMVLMLCNAMFEILTTATGFMSDFAESERGAGAPLAQREIAVGCRSRGLWVRGWDHVKLPRSDPAGK